MHNIWILDENTVSLKVPQYRQWICCSTSFNFVSCGWFFVAEHLRHTNPTSCEFDPAARCSAYTNNWSALTAFFHLNLNKKFRGAVSCGTTNHLRCTRRRALLTKTWRASTAYKFNKHWHTMKCASWEGRLRSWTNTLIIVRQNILLCWSFPL